MMEFVHEKDVFSISNSNTALNSFEGHGGTIGMQEDIPA